MHFIQEIDDLQAERICLETYHDKEWEPTINTVGGVPQLKIGTYRYFDIKVRFARTSFKEPNWDAAVVSGGSYCSRGGFNSYQAAKDWAIYEAEQRYKEY